MMDSIKYLGFSTILMGMVLSGGISPHVVWASETRPGNELIVYFRQEETPDKLWGEIAMRNQESKSLPWKTTIYAWQDRVLRFAKKDTPEIKLLRLSQTSRLAGAESLQKLFPKDAKLAHVYIAQIDRETPLDQAIILYTMLPEVEYAEAYTILQDTN